MQKTVIFFSVIIDVDSATDTERRLPFKDERGNFFIMEHGDNGDLTSKTITIL
jgi:hypothetical protein